jgi:hypothetical protein
MVRGGVSKGAIWAANFTSFTGALLWFFGALQHVQAFVIWFALVVEFINPSQSGTSMYEPLFIVAYILVGPVLVVVGGGMRLVAGLMNGKKVAGRLAARIIVQEWMRYELRAMAVGVAVGAFFVLWFDLSPALTLIVFGGSAGLGIVLWQAATACGRRAAKMMWDVRLEAMRAGMIPYPSGAVPPAGTVPVDRG